MLIDIALIVLCLLWCICVYRTIKLEKRRKENRIALEASLEALLESYTSLSVTLDETLDALENVKVNMTGEPKELGPRSMITERLINMLLEEGTKRGIGVRARYDDTTIEVTMVYGKRAHTNRMSLLHVENAGMSIKSMVDVYFLQFNELLKGHENG